MARRPLALGWIASLALLLACGALPIARAQAPIPPMTSPVVDTTGTLTAAQKAHLEQQALALQQRKGSQLQVLMVPTTQPETIEQYAVRAFEQYKIGRKGIDDAVLLVVAKDDRKVKLEVGYGLEGAIPDITAGRIIQEYLVPKFRAGDYAGGIADATATMVKLIDGEALPAPMADHRDNGGNGGDGGNWVFALFAAFIVANLVRAVFRRMPAGIRGLLTGGAAGGVAWLISSLLGLGIAAAVLGLVYGLASVSAGRFARGGGDWGGFGGGGFGGGGFGGGGGGGGGWSGGGGMSGGGGASGSW